MGNTDIQTFPKDTRALGSNSRWYVANFAIAVTTKHRSLDCDNFRKDWLFAPKPESCLRPRRLHKQKKKNTKELMDKRPKFLGQYLKRQKRKKKKDQE